ncbi:T9SS type A sorting domain-containing protein [Hymenobacter jeollabukensis]|uniref:T9SS type A sorting domain-containing protein n=1 Tax=Hymenobacter jeollabukensis TaxID=2025313 RepID=UPI001485251A|nr:T9SS type A sorting domain-containing protein [Hymenobacter jeollabukensis]
MLKAPMVSTLQSGVNTLAVQADGKILAAGGFDFVGGTLTGKLQRFNTDGTVDATFNAGTGANGFISAVAVQPDGKILVAGGFNTFNGAVDANLVRLNANGSLDATFSSIGAGVPRQPMSLALQPDGKLLVGGISTDLAGLSSPSVVRLNANGTKDTGFNPGTGADGGFVRTLTLQPDGKILAGGSFSTFNGQTANSLVRLNANGSVDATFAASNQLLNGSTQAVLRQASGKLLVAGSFFTNNASLRLLRLLPDGSPDNTFTPGTGPNGLVISMKELSSGAVLLGGSFAQYDGVARGRLARISPDGVLDAAFAPNTGANSSVLALATTSTGQVLIGGIFSQYNATDQTALARLSNSGSLDVGFSPLIEARGTVQQAFPLSNGQLLVGGNLSAINGTTLTGANTLPRRFNADGSLDASYAPAVSGSVLAALPGGGSYVLDNTAAVTVRRLLPGGTLDNGFATRTLASRYGTGTGNLGASLSGAALQPDGKVLLYGVFSSYDGVPRSSLVRLLADGSLDASFVPPASTSLPVNPNEFRRVTAVWVLPGGKILYQWAAYQGSLQQFLTRLNADGSVDNTFAIGTGPANASGALPTFAVLPQSDGKLLVWNTAFTSFSGQSAPYGLTRLTTTGAVDATFSGLTEYYTPRYVQADGKIVATTGSNALSNAGSQLVRLNADGSRDNGYAAVAVPSSIFTGDDVLTGVTQQPTDGKLILYGSFRYVAGQTRIGLARLTNTTLATQPAGKLPQPLTLYPNPAQQQVTVQLPAGAEQLRLLDLQGRLVQQRRLPARQAEANLNLTAVPAGLYLVQVVGAAGLYQQRVVVTH